MSHPISSPARLGPVQAFGLTAAAYFLTGVLGWPFAVTSGSASLLWPAAGVALASVLVFGWRMLPAVALGSFCLTLARAALTEAGASGGVLAAWPLAIGFPLGATGQTLVGALLVRRMVQLPLTLAGPRDVAGFFLAATLSCAVSASVAVTTLMLTHAIPPTLALHEGFTWLLGDVFGVLVVAPIALTLFGEPRDAWAPRRLNVGLSLALAAVVFGLGVRQVERWGDERTVATFQRDAASAAYALTTQFRQPLNALEALRGLFSAAENVSRDGLRRATEIWLGGGNPQAMGWAEPVRPEALAAFEARQRADGAADFRVFDRSGAGATPNAEASTPKIVIRYVEPEASARRVAGLNVLSSAGSRVAVESAIDSGRPMASSAFALTQPKPSGESSGIVVYQAVYRGRSGTAEERRANLLGLAFVALRMNAQLQSAKPLVMSYLKVCVVDTGAAGAVARLAGPPGCETLAPRLLHVRPLEFAGRNWEVRVFADAADVPGIRGIRDEDTALFTLVGLCAMALLGGYLLTVTGRAHRIESAVRERTAALQSEVHEREVAEAALRESEQRFRSILDNVPIGVFYGDLDGNVIQVNASLCALTGHSESELLKMHSADYTHPDDVADDARSIQQLLDGEIPMVRHHKRLQSKSGATVWVRSTVSLLRDANDEARRVIGVVEDITEHLRLEEAEQAREVAESSNRAKSEFLSRMSHELRTPLNAMLGFAQLLDLDRRHPLADAQRPWVAQIQQAGWHLLEMINDVLDLSRIESGNLRLQIEPLNLADPLAASLSMIEADARRRRIVISQRLGDGAAAVLGDATRVKQILTNLLTNAVKYNADAGRIHIESRSVDAERVEITVTDTGLGMTPDQMAQLFQPFNRLGRERSSQEGTGIGLVISQRLAELMGGALEARSTTGSGSSFILTLPRVADDDTVRSDLNAFESLPAEYHRRIVHYVEDNETNVEVMRGVLAQRPQVQMEVSITGLDSLAAIRARRPDLILLDMHLPDISGLELLRHLKADGRSSGIPVVVVSADALSQQIDAAFEAGAAHYLTKPVSVAELLAVVDGLLERMDTRFGSQ